MEKWELTAHKAKNLLTVCLAKAIDQAMIARQGNHWFSDFVQAEATYELGKRIAKSEQKSVRDLDFQALLKILRYREDLANQVLTYYRFFGQLDSYAAEGQRKQLNNLLDRLIKDFRNGIQAHPRAADIERELAGQGVDRLYGYIDAYQDMYKLARVFSDVADSRGYSYAKQILALSASDKSPAKKTAEKSVSRKKPIEQIPKEKKPIDKKTVENKPIERKPVETKPVEQKVNKKKSPLRIWLLLLGAVLVLVVVIVLVWVNIAPVGNIYINRYAPEVIENEISVQPYQIAYEGDELVAVCYIVNGTDQTVTDIDVYRFSLLFDGKEVAAADFGNLNGISLAPGASERWVFRFSAETIYIEDVYLPSLQIEVLCR